MSKKKQRFVGEEGAEAPSESILASTLVSRRRVDISSVRKRKRRKTRTRAKRVYRKVDELDWTLIEQGKRPDKPDLTFSPEGVRQKKWTKVLMARKNDPARLRLEQVLGEKFALIYTRYRRQVQPNYPRPLDEDFKYCRAAARLCILKQVRPFQVIKYWHEHLPHFTGMKFPPLPFLASSGNIDQVSVEAGIAGGKTPGAGGKKPDDPRIHAYSDVGGLHPSLRSGLTSAGFDLRKFSDRHLLTVQATATAVARGHTDMFISSKLRPMVDWAVKNLEGLA